MAVDNQLKQLRVDGDASRDDDPQQRVQLVQNVLQPLVGLRLELRVVLVVLVGRYERLVLHAVIILAWPYGRHWMARVCR